MEKKVYVELPPFTGRNVPITEDVYKRQAYGSTSKNVLWEQEPITDM